MKTTSLAKAPTGHVKVVISPNQEGYTDLGSIKLNELTIGEVLYGLKKLIEEETEKRMSAEATIGLLHDDIKAQQGKIDWLENEIKVFKLFDMEGK